jgi:hypothetical protein
MELFLAHPMVYDREPREVLPIARPGPSIFPYLYAELGFGGTIPFTMRLDPLVQKLFDSVIIYCTAIDAYKRNSRSVSKRQMDTLWARLEDAASKVENRGEDIAPRFGMDSVAFCVRQIGCLKSKYDREQPGGTPLPPGNTPFI